MHWFSEKIEKIDNPTEWICCVFILFFSQYWQLHDSTEIGLATVTSQFAQCAQFFFWIKFKSNVKTVNDVQYHIANALNDDYPTHRFLCHTLTQAITINFGFRESFALYIAHTHKERKKITTAIILMLLFVHYNRFNVSWYHIILYF